MSHTYAMGIERDLCTAASVLLTTYRALKFLDEYIGPSTGRRQYLQNNPNQPYLQNNTYRYRRTVW